MPHSPSSEPALPAAWTNVLDHIQRVLAEALRNAEIRAQALEVVNEPQRLGEAKLASAPLLRSHDHCEELAAETERLLAAAQEALDHWQAKAAHVGQTLAELAGRAV